MRPKLGHVDVRVHPEQGVWSQSLDPTVPEAGKDLEQGCVDLGALGWKKRPKKEASKLNIHQGPRGSAQRGALESVSGEGGRAVSGAQGCPEVKQGVTGPPAGHQQPWQWQVPTKGTEAGSGLRWSAQGRASRRVCVGTGQKGTQAYPGSAGGQQGAVLRALLEADGLRLHP